ncbi:MAG: Na+:solute symporter, partial [Flavobacteriales bacterium]|nr:Na+:solute symporter [Flavobacteriales bacterium]
FGLVLASLLAAFMSTLSTHLNWGSSYLVNDLYSRFIDPSAGQKKLVNLGRLSTLILMATAILLSTLIDTAKGGFDLILQIGAGTGGIYLIRWFWHRVNAWSEISGMVISGLVAVILTANAEPLKEAGFESYHLITFNVILTTATWIIVTLLTKPAKVEVLQKYFTQVEPWGKAWTEKYNFKRSEVSSKYQIKYDLMNILIGCIMVYAFLFGTGKFIYGEHFLAGGLYFLGAICLLLMRYFYKKTGDAS